jgi:hypothetical protein
MTSSIPFGYLLHLMVQGHEDPYLFFLVSLQFLPGRLKDQETGSGAFTAENIDGLQHKDSGGTTVNVETLLKSFRPDYKLFSSTRDISGFMEHQLLN